MPPASPRSPAPTAQCTVRPVLTTPGRHSTRLVWLRTRAYRVSPLCRAVADGVDDEDSIWGCSAPLCHGAHRGYLARVQTCVEIEPPPDHVSQAGKLTDLVRIVNHGRGRPCGGELGRATHHVRQLQSGRSCGNTGRQAGRSQPKVLAYQRQAACRRRAAV